jgi:hypothetical protein
LRQPDFQEAAASEIRAKPVADTAPLRYGHGNTDGSIFYVYLLTTKPYGTHTRTRHG